MIIRGGYNVYPREVEEVLYPSGDFATPPWSAVPTSGSARRSSR
jgi:acyl-CoA synthetase (AMP-forming)/AMP-acid ligase II